MTTKLNSRRGVAAILGSVLAILAIAFVTWPVAANQTFHDIVAALKCSHSTPCLSWKNSGTGTAIQGDSLNNSGVVGFTEFPSLSNQQFSAGVFGSDRSTSGSNNAGVFGTSNKGNGIYGASTGLNGVQGISQSGGASGVYAENDGGGYGMYARTINGGAALTGDNSSGGLAEQLFGGSSSAPDILEASNCFQCGFQMRLDYVGNLAIGGLLYSTGQCRNGCAHHRVESYAPRESVPSIEDFGEARMTEGRAFVSLDRAFANVMDSSAPYLVFLTPEGENRGLFVAGRSRSGFVVKEIAEGRSTLSFAYRIVAKPFGVNAQRLPMINFGSGPHSPVRGGSRR
ncbi:MAG TPA: hypothetical protein VLQ90_10450 [Pyrinomonadaceae bacterium]|nr:hypothetical protein [Pyrinomonadaceae bacterium]